MPRKTLFLVVVLCVCANLWARAATREEILPAGTIIHCTLDEPNFSSKTAQVGDPVLCHLGAVAAFGRPVFPRGAMLSGHLQESKDPGHFVGKGWLELEFDRIILPGAEVLPLQAKIVAAPHLKVDREGKMHVAFERKSQAGLPALWNDEIDRFGTYVLDIGARGVEVCVVRNDISLLAHDAEQDAFGGAPLVCGDHVAKSKDVLNGVAELVETAAAGVAFIALHERRPLMGGHRPGTGVGQQVDQHIIGWKEKQVVMGVAEKLFSLYSSGPTDGFNALDPEWFNDGVCRHSGPEDQQTASRQECQ